MNPPKCNFRLHPLPLCRPEGLHEHRSSQMPTRRQTLSRPRCLHFLDTEALWQEAKAFVDPKRRLLDKPYAQQMELVTPHWSGTHQKVVRGIALLTLLWTDGQALKLVFRVLRAAKRAHVPVAVVCGQLADDVRLSGRFGVVAAEQLVSPSVSLETAVRNTASLLAERTLQVLQRVGQGRDGA